MADVEQIVPTEAVTLAGRGERIRGYSIATSVIGRDENFDPQIDPIRRIETGRLRRALEHYYLTEGRSDPVATVPAHREAAPMTMPHLPHPEPRQKNMTRPKSLIPFATWRR
jgi:adenylate cyclase